MGDNEVPDSVFGTVQRECGCDQFGSTLEESGKFVWSGGLGNVANVGGDLLEDTIDD